MENDNGDDTIYDEALKNDICNRENQWYVIFILIY